MSHILCSLRLAASCDRNCIEQTFHSRHARIALLPHPTAITIQQMSSMGFVDVVCMCVRAGSNFFATCLLADKLDVTEDFADAACFENVVSRGLCIDSSHAFLCVRTLNTNFAVLN